MQILQEKLGKTDNVKRKREELEGKKREKVLGTKFASRKSSATKSAFRSYYASTKMGESLQLSKDTSMALGNGYFSHLYNLQTHSSLQLPRLYTLHNV